MDWFKSTTTQIIALVGIISTLAGFGYTGATYVNRLENLEAKIGGIAAGKENLQNIEERFAAIEATVKAINDTLDKQLILEIRENSNEVTTIAVDVSGLQSLFESLKESIDDLEDDIDDLEDKIEEVANNSDKNPLAN
tara:strand:+ start:546 stop:959 length:414 start_codon:yes stop_codon:yes gene_type:complete